MKKGELLLRQLICSDTRYSYRGPLNAPAFCHLRVFAEPRHPELVTVLFTEVRGNPGISTTNFFERLATQVARELSGLIPMPSLAVWIDHFPLSHSFHRVHMRENGGFFDQPAWELLTEEELAGYLPEEVFKPRKPQPIVEVLDARTEEGNFIR